MHDPLFRGTLTPLNALEGRRIVTTRMEVTNCSLSKALQAQGAIVTPIPLLEITSLPFTPPDLTEFDWIFFTSQNGVHSFFEQQASISPKHFATVGPATASALESYGHTAEFISPVFEAKAASYALIKHLQQQTQTQNQRILWPCGNLASTNIIDIFAQDRIELLPLIVYQTNPVNPSIELQTSYIQANPEVLVFTSASAVNAFANLQLPYQSVLLACIGPSTAQQAQQALGRVDIMAQSHTLTGLVESLCEFFNPEKGVSP